MLSSCWPVSITTGVDRPAVRSPSRKVRPSPSGRFVIQKDAVEVLRPEQIDCRKHGVRFSDMWRGSRPDQRAPHRDPVDPIVVHDQQAQGALDGPVRSACLGSPARFHTSDGMYPLPGPGACGCVAVLLPCHHDRSKESTSARTGFRARDRLSPCRLRPPSSAFPGPQTATRTERFAAVYVALGRVRVSASAASASALESRLATGGTRRRRVIAPRPRLPAVAQSVWQPRVSPSDRRPASARPPGRRARLGSRRNAARLSVLPHPMLNVPFPVVNERHLPRKSMPFHHQQASCCLGHTPCMIRISPRPSPTVASSVGGTSSYGAPATGLATFRNREESPPTLPAEYQDRIFEPFSQVEQTPSRRAGGTGLGLTLTGQLARLPGGGIPVESTPGEGSIFTVQLPHSSEWSSP